MNIDLFETWRMKANGELMCASDFGDHPSENILRNLVTDGVIYYGTKDFITKETKGLIICDEHSLFSEGNIMDLPSVKFNR